MACFNSAGIQHADDELVLGWAPPLPWMLMITPRFSLDMFDSLNRRDWLHAAAAGCAGLVAGCRGGKRAVVEPRWGRVVSHSMAPTWLGPHHAVVCRNCDWEVKLQAPWPEATGFVCPQCGWLHDGLGRLDVQLGDRVRLDLLPAGLSERREMLGRGDIVAVSEDDDSAKGTTPRENSLSAGGADSAVPAAGLFKRIVGLPGERIRFEQGDLLIDDELVSTFAGERLEVLVHDDAGLGRTREQPAILGWEPESGAGVVSRVERGWEWGAAADGSLARLVYQHRRCVLQPEDVVPKAAVEDTLAYSQFQSRPLNRVGDCRVEFRLRLPGGGRFQCAIHSGREWFVLELDGAKGETSLGRIGVAAEVRGKLSRGVEGARISLSTYDRSVTVEIGGSQTLRMSREVATQDDGFTDRPFWLAAQAGTRVDQLAIYRDLYWTGPYGDESQWELGRPLGEDEYFLVGDNLAESVDSRIAGRGVSLSKLIAVARST